MASACIRAETVRRLADMLVARLDVQVLEGWSDRELAREAVVIGPIESVEHDLPTMRAGRKTRDDTFAIVVWFRADRPGQQTAHAARTRAQEMFQALDDICADEPALDGLDGILWVMVDAVDGPDAYAAEEGWQAAMSARVIVHTRRT